MTREEKLLHLGTCSLAQIMLTNIAGPGRYDVMKSMLLLVVDQLMIVCGIISAFATVSATKGVLFAVGCIFGGILYLMTFFIFKYAESAIEDEAARPFIKYMSYCFYTCWVVYPTLFILGSEGPANVMSAEVSAAGHAIADLIAKNTYSALSWYIRWNFVQAQLERNADKGGSESDSSSGSDSESSDEEMAVSHKASKGSRKQKKGKSKGLSVLLVDEASDAEEAAQEALEEAGCTVTIEDPSDATRALRKAYYDFVVVNCMVAGASGFTVVEAIRASKRAFADVPVIALTPRSPDSELKADIDEAEIDDVIVLGKKGISARKLKALLANIREGAIEKSESDAASSSEEETRRSRSSKPKREKSAKVAKKSSRRREEKIERSNSSGSVLSFLDGTVPDKVTKRASSRSASKATKKRSKSREGGVSRASSSGSILAFLDGTKD